MMLFFYTFLAGLTAVLAPCIWPVAFGFIGLATHERNARVVWPGTCFALAFGLIGSLFQLQDRIGPVSFGVAQTLAGFVLLVVAASMVVAQWRVHAPVDPALVPHAPGARSTIRSCVAASALGVAWSPCWGAVLGTVFTIVQSEDLTGVGMLLLATYAAGAALVLGFIGSVARDALWKSASERRQRLLGWVSIVLIALAGTGLAFGVVQAISAWLIPYAPFVFFSL